MSITADDEPKHEIIIVKRGHGDHDEGHHGGVWKIAFADFMTAMMCFFLVMWLINASNEQTKAAVASYFNPVKLIDRNSQPQGPGGSRRRAATRPARRRRGDAEERQRRAGVEARRPSRRARSERHDLPTTARSADEKLFADPYAVLAEIAAETGVLQNVSAKGDGGAQKSGPATGASGGEAYRDPFAPDFWSQQVARRHRDRRGEPRRQEMPPASPSKANSERRRRSRRIREAIARRFGKAGHAGNDRHGTGRGPSGTAKAEAAGAETKPGPTEPSAEAVEAADADPQRTGRGVRVRRQAGRRHLGRSPTDKGVKISVTDQLDFGMFEIGSAVPRRELVLAMEKIGKTLAEQKGNADDQRPHRRAAVQQRQPTTIGGCPRARAQSAYYMLVRGGLDEARITEVVGYADRELKDAADPFGAANRRIEILLDVDG